jgi:sugar O-acyltransferase (sialic acid O-acetyltransferase NeuD family)
MQRIIVICAGGHGRVVADILHCARDAGADLLPVGFVDDTPGLPGTSILGLPVLGEIPRLSTFPHDAIVVALGDNPVRRRMTERFLAAGERLAAAIHPSAVIASTARVGEGAMICANAVIQPGVSFGNGAILGPNASVEHDTRVGDFAHLSAGSTVGAHCQIGDESLIALGATVISRTRIGSRTIIGAGAAVVRDIPDDVIAFGNPARVRSARSSQVSNDAVIS